MYPWEALEEALTNRWDRGKYRDEYGVPMSPAVLSRALLNDLGDKGWQLLKDEGE